DGINQSVGPLCRLDRGRQRHLAAIVFAVGQQNDGLAAWLLFEDFIGGEHDRVVKCSATAEPAPLSRIRAGRRRCRNGERPTAPGIPATAGVSAGATLTCPAPLHAAPSVGGLEFVQSLLELLSR